jgi:hypothetical protein
MIRRVPVLAGINPWCGHKPLSVQTAEPADKVPIPAGPVIGVGHTFVTPLRARHYRGMKGKYRVRSAIRRRLPWFLINLGVADKGERDCGDHDWYNAGDGVEHRYHRAVGERPYDPEHFTDG